MPETIPAPVTLLVQLKARPGKEQLVWQGLLELAQHSTGEAGTLHYEVFASKENSTLFFVLETYVNKPALEAHFTTAHIHRFLELAEELLAEPFTSWPLEQINRA